MIFNETVKWKILQAYFEKPEEEYYVKQLTRKLKTSSGSVSRLCRELEKDGLLESKKNGNALFYLLKNDDPVVKRLKSAWFLNRLMKHRRIWQDSEIQTLALYGSRASGDFISKSDVDLIVITNSKDINNLSEKLKEIAPNRTLAVFTLQKWMEFARKSDRFYIEVISNHILLHGSSLVVG